MERSHLARAEEPFDIAVKRAKGSTIVGANGKRYLDLFAGWCVANLGYGVPEIEARLARFRGPSYVSPSFRYAPWGELSAALAEIAPGRLRRAFRATGGTEAVEIALQAATTYTDRDRILALEGCYHGNSIATMDVAQDCWRSLSVRRIRPPLDALAAEDVEDALATEEFAAFILEPIPLALGVRVPTEEFMRRIARACRDTGTLLIADEVATGFGRTGTMFACERYGLEPDILCLAKAITAGYAPLGATLMTSEVAQGVEGEVTAYSTYGWHPYAVEAALANLAYWRKNGKRILRNVEARGGEIEERVRTMDLGDAEVRRAGLAIGVELTSKGKADGIVERAQKKGLLLTNDEEVLEMFPALTIDARTVTRAMDILERAL